MRIYYQWLQEELAKKIDFANRTIVWINQDNHTFYGDLNSFTGEARLDGSSLYWIAHVKSAQGNFYENEIFAILEDALDWMEKIINEQILAQKVRSG